MSGRGAASGVEAVLGMGIAGVLLFGCGVAQREETQLTERAADVRSARSVPRIEALEAFTAERLQAVDVAADGTVWVSGLGGVWGEFTPDRALRHGVVPGAQTLQLRDIEVVGGAGRSAGSVVALAAGPGAASRLFRSEDRGETWSEVWRNTEAEAFYDCVDFWGSGVSGSEENGFVYGDSVLDNEGRRFRALRSFDGGATWSAAAVTDPLPGEGGFAASGQCVLARRGGELWVGTGAAAQARLLRSQDEGSTWQAFASPFVGGPSAGIFALAMGPEGTLVVVGGSLDEETTPVEAPLIAITDARVSNWQVVLHRGAAAAPTGARFGVAVNEVGHTVTVGPGGITWSSEMRGSHRVVSELPAWSVATRGDTFWMVGPDGLVAILQPQ